MNALKQAISICGSQAALANRIGVRPQAVTLWVKRGVPSERVLAVCEAARGTIAPYDLRPDIYPDPSWRSPLTPSIQPEPSEEAA